MANSLSFPAWICDAISCVAEIPDVELCLVILEGRRRLAETVDSVGSRGRVARVLRAVSDGSVFTKLLGRLNWAQGREFFQWYRDWQIKHQRIPAESPQDLSVLFDGVDQMRCDTMAKGRFAEVFFDEDVERIKTYRLDAILKFGFNIIHGEILAAAKWGVWSYHHDDHLRYRGGPPGFWEVYLADPETGAMLQRINEKLDDGVVLHKEFFNTRLDSYSHNLHRLWTGSAAWPALCCLRLLASGTLESVDCTKSSAPVYRIPRNYQMVKFGADLLRRKLRSRLQPQGPLREQWAIGCSQATFTDVIAGEPLSASRWLVSDPGSFCADPFVLKRGGRDYLFFERFDFAKNRGSIAVTSTVNWTVFEPVEIVLESVQGHYSYPFVFEYQGAVYAVPEQVCHGRVELYELTDFPRGWRKLSAILPDFAGVDPTLFHRDGLWWLMCGGVEDDKSIDTLYAFFAESPLGPWTAHACNPIVVTRARRSRPAGRVFLHEGIQYRPAQNGHRYYGHGLLCYRIDRLNPTEYAESLVRIILPLRAEPFADGLHHLEVAQDRLVFDAKCHFRGSSFPRLPEDRVTMLSLARS
ncbi:MAG: hypothetical protein U0894_20710 [Pirellulales bacterium]